MLPRTALLAFFLALAPLPGARGGDRPVPETVPGVLTLSDGTVFRGRIRTTRGRKLRLFDTRLGRPFDVALGEIHRLNVSVAHEEEYRIWRWVEDGSREKVYTGETRPMRRYETEIVLRNGQVLRGHLVAVLYVYVEGEEKPRKFILKDKDKGRVGQHLSDLVYVDSVRFAGPAPEEGKAAGIVLEVVPPEALVTAHALPREGDRSYQAVRSRTPGRARFAPLLPGTYDLAVVTKKTIFLRLAVGSGGGEPLAGEVRAAVEARVAEIPDFFEDRKVLAGVRNGDKVRVLVLKTRRGPTSLGGRRTFRRYEIWSMHKGGDRWLVDRRSWLWREQGTDLPPPLGFRFAGGLGGIRVKSGSVTVRFAIPGKEER